MTTFENTWNLISSIDGTENIFIATWDLEKLKLSPKLVKNIELIKKITERNITLEDLEKELKTSFGEWKEIYVWDNTRFATAIWWKNTQLHRNAENIILPWSDMYTNSNMQHNISNEVIDPIWWASRAVAPNDYGLLWKIPEFRGLKGNKKFDEELYKELFNTKIITSNILWYAVEINQDETAIMPIIWLEWAEDIILPFSETKKNWDIPTAKYYGLNK